MKNFSVDVEETNIGANAILVDAEGKIILQLRENIPQIYNPGMVGMFGGTINKAETKLQGLKRELYEEITLVPKDSDIEKLNTYFLTKEQDGIDYSSNVFVVKNVNLKDLKLKEGAGFVHDFPEVVITNPKLTRICKLAVQDFIKATVANRP